MQQETLPSSCVIAADVYVFQQDRAPSEHCVRQTIEIFQRETPQFIPRDSWLPYGVIKYNNTRMRANAQPDGRPAEHRWRPLFNAAKFG